MNNLSIVGRITKDLEIVTKGESKYVKFTVAVDRTVKNKEGEKVTDFIPVIAWGSTAERIVKFTGKGKLVSVEGEIHTSPYDKNGEKRISFEVQARNIGFLEWNKNDENNSTNE